MRTPREDGEEGQPHSHPLQKDEAPREVSGLRSEGREDLPHSCTLSSLINEVPLYEDYGQHMSSLSNDETPMIAEGKGEGKLHMVRNICPSLFQHSNVR